MPRSQKTNHHVVDDDDDDDGFYDITGEPVIVQPPLARAKSVKNSIKRPSRHTKSSKDKHNHNSNDSENHHNGKNIMVVVVVVRNTVIKNRGGLMAVVV